MFICTNYCRYCDSHLLFKPECLCSLSFLNYRCIQHTTPPVSCCVLCTRRIPTTACCTWKQRKWSTILSHSSKYNGSNGANGPKGVISKVSAELGGVAADGCSLPRNEQQVTKARLRCKATFLLCFK